MLPAPFASNYNVSCVLVDGLDFIVGTEGGGVYRSTDLGATWLWSTGGLADYNDHALAQDGVSLYVANDLGVYRSDDHGASWSPTSLVGFPIYSLATRDGDLFAGTTELRVYRSRDSGASWHLIGGR